MAFEELAGFVRPGFDLPIGGKTYYVPPPSARDGIWLQAIVDAGQELVVAEAISAANRQVLSDEQERTVYQLALGAAHDEMVVDGVAWPLLKHAGLTALLMWTRDRATAEAYWKTYGQAGDPKANRAARRAAGKRTAKSTKPPA